MGKNKKKREQEMEKMENEQQADAIAEGEDFDGRELKPKRNSAWHGRTRYSYSRPLTDTDRLEMAAKLSDSMAKIEKLQYQLKQARDACKDAIDAERGIVSSCARCIRNGTFEPEQIDCDLYKDFDTNEMVYITHDKERQELHRRKMTAEEMQPTLMDIADTDAENTDAQECER